MFEERYAKLKAGEEEEEEDDDGAGEADDADDHQPMDQEDSSVGVQQLIMAPEAQPQVGPRAKVELRICDIRSRVCGGHHSTLMDRHMVLPVYLSAQPGGDAVSASSGAGSCHGGTDGTSRHVFRRRGAAATTYHPARVCDVTAK